MTEELFSTVVGGVLATLGGLVGWIGQRLYDHWQDEKKGRRELIAAVRLVRYELATNASLINITLTGSGSPPTPMLSAESYRSLQVVLAHGLPDQLRRDVAAAYAEIPLGDSYLVHYRNTKAKEAELSEILERLNDVGNRLLKHLEGLSEGP